MNDISWLPLEAPPTTRIFNPPLSVASESSCRLKLQFAIYFDGTRNSIYVDKASGTQSNIAKLYDLAKDESLECVYRLYIQGVGTAFPKIGEPTAHPDGASKGAMGDRRIRYAILFVANWVAYVANKQKLVEEDQSSITHAVKNDNRIPAWRAALTKMLIPRTGSPHIEEITLDLFGFSRGATAARSFLNQLLKHFGNNDNTFCGIPLRVRFMGLFDTVASVGLADAYPLPVDGHQQWGDAPLLKIPSCVEQCVHMVAAHENRASFPVDLVLAGNSYGPNCMEIVYPGMHADVGGGYSDSDQGKGTQLADGRVRHSQADKLSQIALNDMYQRALKAGVPLLELKDMDDARLQDDFAISPELQDSFDAYMAELTTLKGGAPVTEHMLAHRKLYLGWRKQLLADEHFAQLSFVRCSAEQDRTDLIDANRQLRQRVETFAQDAGRRKLLEQGQYSLATPLEKGFHLEWQQAPAVPPHAGLFLEQYVHDSRAHFVLTDPQAKDDTAQLRAQLEEQDATYQKQLKAWETRHQAYLDSARQGQYIALPLRPLDPMSKDSRQVLDLYRSGGTPVFTDARPATHIDGTLDARDLLYRMSGRRENWSYLRLRHLFAGQRVRYSPAVPG
ncbi:T6SS phospholipase effector Tle1-like catalytic domain-containing protein [Pseudomonas huanghezhanensis]|uniref:T6SS phospholipase effector Tle1-like catalytic domain-containing protein n=1 Tax=Pseudomonas huanghezhanensis TaxID=3002903 RepID=UPI002286501C|nr:DUF2235 domain-containing protein [Pseudomonas sp. BSw22131]